MVKQFNVFKHLMSDIVFVRYFMDEKITAVTRRVSGFGKKPKGKKH